MFFPLPSAETDESKSMASSLEPLMPSKPTESIVETSILDHIRELLLSAQSYGCWQEGVGGVGQPPSDRYVASVLNGIPVSSVLNCAIELWRNLEIDDDELLEIAIRDVSYQIKLQQEREVENMDARDERSSLEQSMKSSPSSNKGKPVPCADSFEKCRHRFNPRKDPTVIYLEMKKLTLNLTKFRFRIEKQESKRTIFDPFFEGCGSLMVRNVSIKLRIECVKERILQRGSDASVLLLQLRELDVRLEKVNLTVQDTGADWFLNQVVERFSENIARIMATNLKEQVQVQIELALENINSYFAVNPEMLLGLLGITMEDLEEKVVWV